MEKDPGLADEKALKAAGAKGVIRPGKNCVQVIIGLKVQAAADALHDRLQQPQAFAEDAQRTDPKSDA